jgi:hypothetical protein
MTHGNAVDTPKQPRNRIRLRYHHHITWLPETMAQSVFVVLISCCQGRSVRLVGIVFAD